MSGIAIISLFAAAHSRKEYNNTVEYITSSANSLYYSAANALSSTINAFSIGDYERFEYNYNTYVSCLIKADYSLNLATHFTDLEEVYPNACKYLSDVCVQETEQMTSAKSLFDSFSDSYHAEFCALLHTGQDSLENRLAKIEEALT